MYARKRPKFNRTDESVINPHTAQSSSISKLLADPTVLRQLQELQKLKQQDDKQQSKLLEMRKQEDAFEQHLTTVIKVRPALRN